MISTNDKNLRDVKTVILMDKKIILIMGLLVLLSVTMFASAGVFHVKTQSSPPVHNLNTGLNYASIQDAINAPQTTNGNTILVDPGTYTEQIVVNKTLTVVGANAETTIIDGQNIADYLFHVIANNAVIENFTLENTKPEPSSYSPAVRIYDATNVTVRHIITADVVIGIDVSSVNFTSILNCVINQSRSWGIRVRDKSSNNAIVGNTIENNPTAIGFTDAESSWTRVYHNSFINNTNQVTSAATNYFDNGYPSGGNYWSDYTGVDSNSDGVGDTPYGVYGTLEDKYPLMGIFFDFAVISETKTCHVTAVSNSTVSAFGFLRTNRSISFNVSVLTGTAFCGIGIPYGLIFPPYNVTMDGVQNPYSDVCDNGTFKWIYFTYNNTQHTVMIQSAASIHVRNPTGLSPAYVHPGTALTVTTAYTETSILNLTIEVFNSTSIISNLTITEELQNGTDVTRSDELFLEESAAEGFYSINITLFNTDDLSREAAEVNSVIVDVTAPTIGDMSQNPPADSVRADDAVRVNVEVTDALSRLKQVRLSYVIDDGSWSSVAMTNLVGDIYNATIPSFAYNTNVTYVITAEDNANNTVTTQDLGYMFHYRVVPEFPTVLILLVIMIGTLSAVAVYRRTLFRRKPTYF